MSNLREVHIRLIKFDILTGVDIDGRDGDASLVAILELSDRVIQIVEHG